MVFEKTTEKNLNVQAFIFINLGAKKMQFGASFSLEKLQISDLVAIKRIGFDFAEFYINEFWTDLEELKLQLIAVRDVMDSYDLFSIIHLPHMNSELILDNDLWTNYIDRISEQISVVGQIGITNILVFHGVFGRSEDPIGLTCKEILKSKDLAIIEWLDIAKKFQMKLLLENTDESVDDLKEVFKKHKNLDFTFDIGHANILFHNSNHKTAEEKIYLILDNFKNKLAHIHIHDNLGGFNESADKHLPIGTGDIDFTKFFTKLHEMKYSKTITIEIPNSKYQTIYLDASNKVLKEILAEIRM